MRNSQKRRIRDRFFIDYEPNKHLARAYAVASSQAVTWDLFPPVKGYRPYNAKSKSSYNVSPQRQHSDWAKIIIERDGYKCTECASQSSLEAHHIWPQGWFPQLRYVPENGITLCRPCHDSAFHATEITPNQFFDLTKHTKKINKIIEAENFWTHYVAGLEKGRVLAHQLLSVEQMCMDADEKDWFLEWASLNHFLDRTMVVAREAPIKDQDYKISEEIELQIKSLKPEL